MKLFFGVFMWFSLNSANYLNCESRKIIKSNDNFPMNGLFPSIFLGLFDVN